MNCVRLSYMKTKPTMNDLLMSYQVAFKRANGVSYHEKIGYWIGIRGSWFILQSCKVQRTELLQMIDRLDAR